MRKKIKKLGIILLAIIVIPLLIPQNLEMPVQGATNADFNPQTFWYYPWGSSIVHKGVDIFAKRGTSVHAATMGIVLFTGRQYGKCRHDTGASALCNRDAYSLSLADRFIPLRLAEDVLSKSHTLFGMRSRLYQNKV